MTHSGLDVNTVGRAHHDTLPTISLIIPAYNEATRLPALLDSVDAARFRYRGGTERIDVVVADNASTDDTAAIAVARGCRVAHVEKRLIAAARNGGAAIAAGEIFAFIDGDSRIHPETFNVIANTLADGTVIVGATSVNPERWSLGIWMTWVVATIITWILRLDAGVVYCRREDFTAVGGYDETLEYAEDVKFLDDLKKRGHTRGQHFKRTREAIGITSTRKFDTHGDWHYFTKMPRVAFWMLIDKSRVRDFTQRYWYKDR